MSEERLSKIEDKVTEHERSITQLTYISNELKIILEKMNEKLDSLHTDWARTMSDVRSYTDMQRLFKETTDEHCLVGPGIPKLIPLPGIKRLPMMKMVRPTEPLPILPGKTFIV